MVVVPLAKGTNELGSATPSKRENSPNWIRIAAATSLAASGALLLTGNRRAGLLTAISGAALAMLDQQDAVCAWWNALPAYLEEADDLLGRAQTVVADLSVQGQKLRKALGK
jgi:hypothetical protein